MKTVFSNIDEVCHVFASKSQSVGRCGAVSFSGGIFYSYAAPIGYHAKIGGREVTLLCGHNYSVTTAKHQNYLARACRHLGTLTVADLSAGGHSSSVDLKAVLQAEIETLSRLAVAIAGKRIKPGQTTDFRVCQVFAHVEAILTLNRGKWPAKHKALNPAAFGLVEGVRLVDGCERLKAWADNYGAAKWKAETQTAIKRYKDNPNLLQSLLSPVAFEHYVQCVAAVPASAHYDKYGLDMLRRDIELKYKSDVKTLERAARYGVRVPVAFTGKGKPAGYKAAVQALLRDFDAAALVLWERVHADKLADLDGCVWLGKAGDCPADMVAPGVVLSHPPSGTLSDYLAEKHTETGIKLSLAKTIAYQEKLAAAIADGRPLAKLTTVDGLAAIKRVRAAAVRPLYTAGKYLAKAGITPEAAIESMEAAFRLSGFPIDEKTIAGLEAVRRVEVEAENREAIAQWRAGESVHLPHDLPPMLRLSADGKQVETSWRAVVPVEVCPALWALVQKCRETGEAYTHAGPAYRVGYYSLDSIDVDGTLHIGCHDIAGSEVDGIARALGYTGAFLSDTVKA